MPFTKETAKIEGSKGTPAREKQKQDWWAFIASGGLRKYNELMIKLSKDEPIGKWQQQFLDRSEKSFPFIKARKTDITSGGEKLPTPILNAVSKDNSD